MAVSSPHAKAAEPSRGPGNGAIPPLKDGDRLTRAEFERRYMAMPDLKKAELIEGVVHVGSPVRQRFHGRQHSHLNFWLCAYEGSTPGVEVGDNSTYGSTLITCPSRIACCSFSRNTAGEVRIDDDGYIEGAPDLVAEVAASSVSLDLGNKLTAYRRNGVREYVVWRCSSDRLTGSCTATTASSRYFPAPTGYCAARCFPVSGSIRPPGAGRCQCGARPRPARAQTRASTGNW